MLYHELVETFQRQLNKNMKVSEVVFMKVKLFILLILLFCVSVNLTAQTKRSNKTISFSLSTPRKTFTNYLIALKNNSFDDLNQVFSKLVKETFGKLNADSSQLKFLTGIENYEKVRILHTFINENSATLVVHDGVNNMPSIIYFVKEDNGWKIAISAGEGDILNSQQSLNLETQAIPISPRKKRRKKYDARNAPPVSIIEKPQ